MGDDEDEGTAGAYGRTIERLQRVKAAYDPDNVFRLNQNITPVSAAAQVQRQLWGTDPRAWADLAEVHNQSLFEAARGPSGPRGSRRSATSWSAPWRRSRISEPGPLACGTRSGG